MKRFVTLCFAVAALAGCTSTGDLSTQGAAVVKVLCTASAATPAALAVSGQVAVTLDPTTAGDVALASALDQIVHPSVTAACASVNATVAAVTVTNPTTAVTVTTATTK